MQRGASGRLPPAQWRAAPQPTRRPSQKPGLQPVEASALQHARRKRLPRLAPLFPWQRFPHALYTCGQWVRPSSKSHRVGTGNRAQTAPFLQPRLEAGRRPETWKEKAAPLQRQRSVTQSVRGRSCSAAARLSQAGNSGRRRATRRAVAPGVAGIMNPRGYRGDTMPYQARHGPWRGAQHRTLGVQPQVLAYTRGLTASQALSLGNTVTQRWTTVSLANQSFATSRHWR